MTEKESLQDAIENGFYRVLGDDGKIYFTDGQQFFEPLTFAKVFQHGENINNGRFYEFIYYTLEDIEDDDEYPIAIIVASDNCIGKTIDNDIFYFSDNNYKRLKKVISEKFSQSDYTDFVEECE
jgi:hypothetical protein